jgi:hypothetical protein
MNALMYELPASVCAPMLDKPMRRSAKPAMISIAPKSFKRIALIYAPVCRVLLLRKKDRISRKSLP